MKKLLLLLTLSTICSCSPTHQVVFKDQQVDLEHFSLLINDDSFPLYANGCTVVGYTKKYDNNQDYIEYIDGQTFIFDRDSNKLAEWKYDRSDLSYSNLKFYKTDNGINYCFTERKDKIYCGEGGMYNAYRGTIKKYKLDNEKPYLFLQKSISRKKDEIIEYYPNKQIKHRVVKKAKGDPQISEIDETYYEMETVVNDYFNPDGTPATITDIIYNGKDYAVFTSNLIISGSSLGLHLILFKTSEISTRGEALLLYCDDAFNTWSQGYGILAYNYEIAESEIRLYNGHVDSAVRVGEKNHQEIYYKISDDNETICAIGRFRRKYVKFELSNITLRPNFIEHIQDNYLWRLIKFPK